MNEPPVRYWVMGANEWRSGNDWPLPETQWTKFYLNSWERLQTAPFTPSSADDELPPDAFVQMPPTQTNAVQKLRYLTDPLPQDLLIAGPAVLNLFAEIDQDDTNWIVSLKDVGPDVSVRTVREGEREIPHDLPEREVTRGWLKASHRALDPRRSKPWKPWHPLDARCAEEGHARGDRELCHRDHGDGQPVPARPPHLHRDHERRHAHRRRRRDERRICAESHLQQPHHAAQDLPRCAAALASAAARHPAIRPTFGDLMSEARQVTPVKPGPEIKRFRRIVTGHDAQGRSMILSDACLAACDADHGPAELRSDRLLEDRLHAGR